MADATTNLATGAGRLIYVLVRSSFDFKNCLRCACIEAVTNEPASLPADLAAAHAMILAERSARRQAEALVSAARLEIERLRLLLAKARREQFGQTSERGKRLIDQLELQLAELEETAAEDEAAAEAARRRPARSWRRMSGRSPPGGRCRSICRASGSSCRRPTTCRCCGGSRLAKIGEVVTETLDVVPRRWFVRQTVREKFTCRDCETISEPPAPFHVIPRGRIGASLLAMILFEKYGAHQPLNRQSERYAREGVDLDLSTMADHVGAGAAVLAPLHELIRGHVLAAERLHGDDTTVPVLAKGKTITGRLWAYVRDDRPFGQRPAGGPLPLFARPPRRASRAHLAGYAGILQADAYSGFAGLYTPTRAGGAVTEALCWAHARRKFFELADLARAGKAPPAPLAVEAVRQIDAIFAHEREINGRPAADRLAYRREHAAPLVGELEAWMKSERPSSPATPTSPGPWTTCSSDGPPSPASSTTGRICLTNNAAERALRGVALGRKSWLFVGSDRGGAARGGHVHADRHRQAQRHRPAGLARRRPRAHRRPPIQRLPELLPWNWANNSQPLAA